MLVAILLSTYNGEKYISELLDSVLSQTHQTFHIYISDDGSTDHTMEIINSYALRTNKISIVNDTAKRQGACMSFMRLLSLIDADYYFFCDQDDIWLPTKIEKCLKRAELFPKNAPVLIHTDLVVVDESLNTIHSSFWNFNKTCKEDFNSFNFHCAYNNIPGCSMMINKFARDLSFPAPSSIKMHDAWITLVISFHNGVMEKIDEPLILYRQHVNNTIGAKKTRSILQKILNLNSIIKENYNLFITVNALKKTNIPFFLSNKIKVYLNLKKR